MNYFLTENQLMIRDLAREITLEQVIPRAAELDEKEEFPTAILDILAKSGFMGLYIPEAYGGLAGSMGGGCLALCIATEELSRGCGGTAVSYAANALGSFPILLFGTEEQKKKYIPDIASGKHLAAFGLTEANAGSDAQGIETTARKDGDYYILNGTKQWITNAGEADVYSVIAMTDKKKGGRGATAFIVEKGTPGFDFGKKEKKMGIRCSTTRGLIFEDVKVHKDQILGKEGLGFIVTMKTLDNARPGVAAQAVGMAQAALDHAVKYSRERRQFGQPICSFQAIQHMMADMATQIEAARAIVYATARMIDAGVKDFSRESAMCKLFATDACMKVTTDALQIFGGYGYMREYPMEKLMRDAKITQIYEGTNQIQRNVIALDLIKEAAKRK
ncbi:MAG: acyl-CoA dehydrogenase family protein [bacterium]